MRSNVDLRRGVSFSRGVACCRAFLIGDRLFNGAPRRPVVGPSMETLGAVLSIFNVTVTLAVLPALSAASPATS